MIYGDHFDLSYYQFNQYIEGHDLSYIIDDTDYAKIYENIDRTLIKIAFAICGLGQLSISAYKDNKGIIHIIKGVEYFIAVRDFILGELAFPKMEGEFDKFSGKKYEDLSMSEKRQFFSARLIYKIDVLDYQTDYETKRFFIKYI